MGEIVTQHAGDLRTDPGAVGERRDSDGDRRVLRAGHADGRAVTAPAGAPPMAVCASARGLNSVGANKVAAPAPIDRGGKRGAF